MRRLLFAAIAAVVFLPTASVAAPAFMWTGCYIGANLGYGWGPTTWSDNGVDFTSHTASGVIGGGQIGCDYQNGPWVFGVQGLFDAAGLKGSGTNFFLDPAGGVIDTSKITWLAMLTGRLGYTLDPITLLYIKGGVAWVHAHYTECCQPTVIIRDIEGFLEDGEASVTRTGLTLGTGLEHAFGPNWSAFIEYDFIRLGGNSVTFSPINNAPGPFIYNIEQNVHMILVGLNYRFGPNWR